MSSKTFGVILQADRSGRRVVFLSGVLLMWVGIALIATLPMAGSWRLLLLVIWLVDCGLALRRLAAAWSDVKAIGLDNAGTLRIVGPHGNSVPITLASGSFVCRRGAWLRLRLPDGSRHGELLLAGHAGDLVWHRFQLIWRLGQKTFGHPGRA